MAINNTKIKFIKVLDKLYQVDKISFYDFSVTANETEWTLADVSLEEVFDITDFKDFRVILRNWHGTVVDFEKYIKKRKEVS